MNFAQRIIIIFLLSIAFLYATNDASKTQYGNLIMDINTTMHQFRGGCRWEYSEDKNFHQFNYACPENDKYDDKPNILFSIKHKPIRSYSISRKTSVVLRGEYPEKDLERNKKILIDRIILLSSNEEAYGGVTKLKYFKLYLIGDEVIVSPKSNIQANPFKK
jgi:hypothetical protein